MILLVLFALAFGSPNMSFPWWVWTLAITHGAFVGGNEVRVVIKNQRR